jgi:tetratricopeptide (TPR) repeat protein
LAQRPGDAEVLQALGSFEYQHGQIDAAIEAFDAALRADPRAATSQADLARALADANRDLPRALELARAARNRDPKNAAFAEALARVLHRSGLHRAAVEQLRDAIDLAPHPIAAYHYRLGVVLMDAGRSDEATRELKQALDLDASFEGAEDAHRRLETHRPRHSALGPS